MNGRLRWLAAVTMVGLVLGSPALGWSAEQASPFTYSSGAIRGRVISGAGGRPLARVSVVAFWTGHQGVPLFYSDVLDSVESVSGDDGRFVLPGWGPVLAGKPMSRDSPVVLCLAPGYKPEVTGVRRHGRVEDVEYEVRLRLFEGDTEAWAKTLRELVWYLAYMSASLSAGPEFRILEVIEAEWKRLPGELREGPEPREAFGWWREALRRAREQSSVSE